MLILHSFLFVHFLSETKSLAKESLSLQTKQNIKIEYYPATKHKDYWEALEFSLT